MNERDALRFAARRAALLIAVRDGDALVAARAASRLRIPAAPIVRAEFGRARQARLQLGRAILSARMPKRESAPRGYVSTITAPRPDRRRSAVAALAVSAVLLVLLVGGPGTGGEQSGAQDSAQAAAEAQRAQLLTLSRGRTISIEQPIIVVQATPTPAPSAAPQPTAAGAAAARTAAPGGGGSGTRTAAPGGTSGGSGPGGGGGGVGIGVLPTPAPATPRPVPTRPIPLPGFSRISVTVLDGRTFLPIADVCVLLNDRACTASKTRTDERGKWADDIPVTTATVFWDVYFVKPGYGTVTRRVTLQSQRTIQLQVFLFRS